MWKMWTHKNHTLPRHVGADSATARAYPLRPKSTGQEVKALLQTADSLQASPLLRLATWSSNTSPLLLHPSAAASTHRGLPRRFPPLWGDLSAHSSNREPYPVDKLLKFRSWIIHWIAVWTGNRAVPRSRRVSRSGWWGKRRWREIKKCALSPLSSRSTHHHCVAQGGARTLPKVWHLAVGGEVPHPDLVQVDGRHLLAHRQHSVMKERPAYRWLLVAGWFWSVPPSWPNWAN